MQKIIERQNEEQMLKVQFAARYCYNRAELLNNILTYATLINLLIFIPFPSNWMSFIRVSTMVIDCILCIIIFAMNKYVETGASLRNFFDAYVLDIGYKEYSLDARSKLFDIAFSITKKHPQLAEIQLNNTGSDSPPGVKSWYEFPFDLIRSDAVYTCQKANAWWDKKLSVSRISRFLSFLLITIVTIICLRVIFNLSLLDLFLGSLAIIIKLIERIVAAYKYHVLSIKIDGALETISCNPKISYEIELQKMIEARRKIPVLGSNKAHIKSAKKLTEQFNTTQV